MAAAAAIVGPRRVERALACTRALIDLFAHSGLMDGRDEDFDTSAIKMDEATRALFLATEAEAADPRPEAMLAAVKARGGKSAFLKYLGALEGRLSRDAILAAIALTIAWGPLMRKRISRLTAETLPWYLRLYGVMVGATIPGRYHQSGSLHGIPRDERFGKWTMADLCFLAMTGKKPTPRGGAAAADPRRPPDLQRPRRDLGAGRQGGGLGRRAADAGPGADQQGHGRVSDPHRLQPRRQRLRGHGLPARPVQGQGPDRPHRPRSRHRPQGDGDRLRRAPTSARRPRRRSSAPRSARCPASTTRSSRASRSTTTRASASSPPSWKSAATTTSSTLSIANWFRRSTMPARRLTSSASTSTP